MTNCPTIWRSTTSTATGKSTEPGFTEAAHVVRVELHAQRISGNPMEPKSCTALYDAADETFEICIPTQGTGDLKAALSQITGLAPEKFRIRSADVGGGFGVRHEVYPEFLAVMLAAKRTGKPVKWLGTRSETMSGDHHGRAADLIGELAVDSKGKFLALRVQWLVNLGAYCSNSGPLINTIAAPTSSAISLYNIPAVHGRHRLVFTNTTPTTAYRGAGRPNVAYLWERLVEEAAVATGINSIKLRRRNVLRKKLFPMKTPTGSTYDSGDPARLLDTALKASDWDGFEKRRQAAKREGKLRGIGLALFLEPSGGMGKEQVELRVEPDGRLSMFSLAGPSGQGHETVYPALVADILGVPEDRIDLRYNDVNTPKLIGVGTFGSRSLISHGAALAKGAREIVEKGKALAARQFEVAADDVTFADGQYRVVGTDLSVSMQALIEKRWGEATHPLDTNVTLDLANAFPSGAHVAEVEIDPQTGAVSYRQLHRRRRLRHDLQSHAGRGPAPRRADAGHRPGVRRAHCLRSRQRPALVRHLHGLFHAAGAQPAADRADRLRRAVAGQPARREGRGRGRRDRSGSGAGQCGARRAEAGECGEARDAVHISSDLARHSSGRLQLTASIPALRLPHAATEAIFEPRRREMPRTPVTLLPLAQIPI